MEQVGTECKSIGCCDVAAGGEGEYALWISGCTATIPFKRIRLITGVETIAEVIVRWYCLIVNVHQAWIIAAVRHC